MIALPYQKYQLGDCLVNCHDMTISVDERQVQLPAKVFEFLKLLILNAGQTVTKEEAIEQVWQGNVEVGKRGTGNAIWHLRKSFGELGVEQDDVFKTITKVGYQLLIQPIGIEESQSNSVQHTPEQTKQPVSRYGVLAIIIIAITAAVVWQFATQNTEVVVQTTQPTPVRLTNFEGVEEQSAVSPDGHYLAFQWRRQGKKGQLFIKDLSNHDAPLRQVSMTMHQETSPSWSPDSQSLAYLRIEESGSCSVHLRELITNRDTELTKGCISTGYLHGLNWSPDGTKLAFARSVGDRVAAFAYFFETGEVKQLTFPEAGEEDLMMVWSGDSQDLVFVRSLEMNANILLSDAQGKVSNLVDQEVMVIGLTWDHANNHVYYNASTDGDFVVHRLNMNTNEREPFHRDNTISSISINKSNNELFYSRHVAQEHISMRSMQDGRVLGQIMSSSRDLFGQFVPTTGEMLFMSNRTGTWEIFLKKDQGSEQLTFDIGQMTIPAVAPDRYEYVMAVKEHGAKHYQMKLGALDTKEMRNLFMLDADVRNPSYSKDGKRLYFSANIGGAWGIHYYDFASQEIHEVLVDGGKYAIEDSRGGIYYTRDNTPGIYYFGGEGATPVLVSEALRTGDWGSFFLQDDELYFLARSETNDILVRLDENGVEHEQFSLPLFSIRNEKALGAGYENTVVLTMLGVNDADIYTIPTTQTH